MNEHRVVVYKDESGQWRWRRVAANNRIVADSGEGYTHQGDCFDALRAVNARPYILELEGQVQASQGRHGAPVNPERAE